MVNMPIINKKTIILEYNKLFCCDVRNNIVPQYRDIAADAVGIRYSFIHGLTPIYIIADLFQKTRMS